MAPKKLMLSLILLAGMAIAPMAGGPAMAQSPEPVAQAAGGDLPPVNPAIVGVPIRRTTIALDKAADAVDAGQGLTAVGPLKSSRRYLLRSYRGAKALIATAAAPPPAEEASAARLKFQRLARRIRASRRSARLRGRSIRARASQADFEPPVIADAATAVFNVFSSQYDAATTAIGMLPDVTGNLLTRVSTTVNTAVSLRNRLVKLVAAYTPPVAGEARAAHGPKAQAAQDEAVTFDVVMPGLSVLIADEIQQIEAMQADATVPPASSAVLTDVLAADTQILTTVNTMWPPETP